jgi:hypothetical protein
LKITLGLANEGTPMVGGRPSLESLDSLLLPWILPPAPLECFWLIFLNCALKDENMSSIYSFLVDLGFFYRGAINYHRAMVSHMIPSYYDESRRGTMHSDLFLKLCRFAWILRPGIVVQCIPYIVVRWFMRISLFFGPFFDDFLKWCIPFFGPFQSTRSFCIIWS